MAGEGGRGHGTAQASRRSAWARLVAVVATSAACGSDPPEAPEAIPSATPAPSTSAAAPLVPWGPSGSFTRDAGTDAPADTGPGPDAGTAGPRTLVDAPGVLDFDFTQTRLVYRVARDFFTCELPCTSPTRLPGTANHKNRFTVTPDRLYFAARVPPSTIDDVYSVAFDGTKLENRTHFAPAGGQAGAHVEALALDGGLTRIEQLVSLVREREVGYRTLLEVPTGMTGNPDRVGHTTRYVHENHGAVLRYFPKQVRLQVSENNPDLVPTPAEMTVTGTTMVPPPSDPTAIATSPRGPSVAYPTVVIRERGTLKACPVATACTAWSDLGPLGETFALDATHLYIGSGRGLSRCELAEIAQKGQCSPALIVGGEPARHPMYLTDDSVVYLGKDRVRAVPKNAPAHCAAGTGAACQCAPGSVPDGAGTCAPCPRGTFASLSGQATCTPCLEGTTPTPGATSAASCVACPEGETAGLFSSYLCVPTPKRVFVTAESHDGDFANDPQLVGANAIAKADAFCMQSSSRPSTAAYKAVLADTTNRDALVPRDWPFLPARYYLQPDGPLSVGLTSAQGLLPFPLTNPWDGDPENAYVYFWTGIRATTWASSTVRTCQGWSSNASNGVTGAIGIAGRTDGSAVGTSTSASCSIPQRLLCVEQ